ncbi:MAG TPA: hypothetical protein VLA23_08300 [Candidatus Limnocylindrales bacterium]|nr:hypothetical protein [Candidatus Limnocylindrales bacterium]
MDPTSAALWLADWRRRVADLYADVRAFATEDPVTAWPLARPEARLDLAIQEGERLGRPVVPSSHD